MPLITASIVAGTLIAGGVIRQARTVDHNGNFRKEKRTKKLNRSIMKSAFDDEKVYELTELGKQFVHYAKNEIIPKIE